MVLGGRYEILNLIGEGGMGAVYKARDRALDRLLALKVIRPELASQPDILQRFKQEILLASKVTHRNVIRIFDLGEADGVKFITMEFVEGEDLRTILHREGKLGVQESVSIIEQTLSGLEAAHRQGIIHRDLKPSNIMRDAEGRVVVMDFGLARNLAGDGMTRTGLMLGTMEYMSPEQAQAKDLDARSDIFTVGLIFYELLSGKMPYHAESAIASLLRRTQERAIPVSEVEKNVPGILSNIISKCLERDPGLRYQNAGELLDDLHAWQGKSGRRKVSVTATALWMNRMRQVSWARIATVGGLLATLLVGVAWYFSRKAATSPATAVHTPVSVLVGDFTNNTGDDLFDDTLEPMFNVALEGASFVSAFNRGNARQLAAKLPNGSQKLDEQTSRLVAVDAGVAAIVTGTLDKQGSGYRLSVKAIDAVTGKMLARAGVNTANKDDLLMQVPKLAVPIRKALGDTTPESVQLAEAQGTFSTSNLEAVHQYSMGMEQQSAGKMEEALQTFSKAVALDPNFARAYAGMAAAAGNLGQSQAAEKYAKLAIAHVDRMTERERYRVRGQYYIRTENWQKCIEEYSELLKQYQADNIGYTNLALCYGRSLNMARAMEVAQQAVQITPRNLLTRMNSALYACYASEFETCEKEGREALQLNPSYEEGYFAIGYAQLGQNRLTDAAETYQQLSKMGPWGASLAACGLANLAMYQGRFNDAIQILRKGAADDLAAKNPDAAADKYWMLAQANLFRGDRRAATDAADRALAISQSVKTRFLVARILTETGDTAKARKIAASLADELQAAPQAYAKLISGELALKANDARQAVQLFDAAKQQLDTWIGRFNLGRAYLAAGAFAEADSEFDRCIKRRGEALEFFMDDMPTYSLLPVVYYYQGRVREGLKSPESGASYRAYLDIRGMSTEDPLLAEVRRRLRK
jgi:tetratricopeptide (TPR) repeat protein/predicted Ser/Thr protein kinase